MKPFQRTMAFAVASFLMLAGALAAGMAFSGSLSQAHAAGIPTSYFAPYSDVTLNGSTLQPIVQSTGQKYYTLAFIDGNGCNAEWAATIPLNQTSTYLPHLDSDIQSIRNQGGDIIIAFGGAAGQELGQTCSTAGSLQAQYQAVINQYHVTHLDFDIENGAQGDATSYDRRNTALAALQQANSGLTISFTLPSAKTGLLSDSIGMLKNAVSHGVNFSIVNLMTMDYGGADSQMGQDAINAANSLHSELQDIFPSKSSSQLWAMVGITPMIGQNDSAGEIFSQSNAQQVLSFAQTNKIGELALWSISRDNGSCAGATTASPTCSGVSQNTYDFTNIFKAFGSSSSSSCGGTTPTSTVTDTSTPTLTVTPTTTPTTTAASTCTPTPTSTTTPTCTPTPTPTTSITPITTPTVTDTPTPTSTTTTTNTATPTPTLTPTTCSTSTSTPCSTSTATPSPTSTLTPGTGLTPTPGVNISSFSYGVDASTSASLRPWFQPCGWSADYVILHYILPGKVQENVYTTYASDSGRWGFDTSRMQSGQVLKYSFTYSYDYRQYDTVWYTWTQS